MTKNLAHMVYFFKGGLIHFSSDQWFVQTLSLQVYVTIKYNSTPSNFNKVYCSMLTGADPA